MSANDQFDPAEFAAAAPSSGDNGFDPAEFKAMKGHFDSQVSPIAKGFFDGLATNKPTKGLFNTAVLGREALPMVAATAALPLAGALGATGLGLPAASALEGGAGGVGEALRQGVVKMTGGEPDFSSVPRTAAAYSAGPVLGKAVGYLGGVAGELGGKALSKFGDYSPEALAALKEAPSEIMNAASKASQSLPPVAKALRDTVNQFVDDAGTAYGAAKDALVNKFGDQQIVPRKGMLQEMKGIIADSSFNPKSETDRPLLREVGRLVKDATAPFSGSIDGAIEMSQRFAREQVYGKDMAVPTPKGTPAYQKLIGDLKAVVDRNIDSVDPTGDFKIVRQGYNHALQMTEDAASFLNAKDMPARMRTAMASGNDDMNIIHRIQTVVPDTIDAFNRMRNGIYGQYFSSPVGKAVGYGVGFGNKAVTAVAPGIQHLPPAVLNEYEAAKGGHK